MTTYSTITVTAEVAGLHHWPDAPYDREYLAHDHRHLFHVEVTAAVHHDDRAIEFHDLQEQTARAMSQLGDRYRGTLLLNFGPRSCEMLAGEVLHILTELHGPGIIRSVTVSEDNENDATVFPLTEAKA